MFKYLYLSLQYLSLAQSFKHDPSRTLACRCLPLVNIYHYVSLQICLILSRHVCLAMTTPRACDGWRSKLQTRLETPVSDPCVNTPLMTQCRWNVCYHTAVITPVHIQTVCKHELKAHWSQTNSLQIIGKVHHWLLSCKQVVVNFVLPSFQNRREMWCRKACIQMFSLLLNKTHPIFILSAFKSVVSVSRGRNVN